MIPFVNYPEALQKLGELLLDAGLPFKSSNWQSDSNNSKGYNMIELMFVSFSINYMPEDLETLQKWTKANQPWCDMHFQERIGGKPLNPGESYKIWPFFKHIGERFRENVFSHTYMERFWPKHANFYNDTHYNNPNHISTETVFGIRYEVGDLNDLINLLKKDPTTRQAYLPVWFPEDTGAVFGGRVPCTLGYHFILRGGQLHMVYYIRSCDYVRHFADDIYLANRLAIHILETLKEKDKAWYHVTLGKFIMHISSLHAFDTDQYHIKKSLKQWTNV